MIMILPSALRVLCGRIIHLQIQRTLLRSWIHYAGNLQFGFLLKIEPHYQGLLFEEAYK